MKIEFVALKDINPWDDNHPPDEANWNIADLHFHQKGIAYFEEQIKAGRTIAPIAIRETKVVYFNTRRTYERLDGYKRYMAHHNLGKTHIVCLIYDENDEGVTPGMQHGMNGIISL